MLKLIYHRRHLTSTHDLLELGQNQVQLIFGSKYQWTYCWTYPSDI